MDCNSPAPVDQHKWLQKLVGKWTSSADCVMGPDQPVVKSEGKETVRAVGPYWIIGEGEATMPDGTAGQMMLTLGYDPAKKAFVGSWIGSMMNFMWTYLGELDASGKKLTLNTEGPSFAGDGSIAKYREIIEIISDHERSWRSEAQAPDGKWITFMTARYKRMK